MLFVRSFWVQTLLFVTLERFYCLLKTTEKFKKQKQEFPIRIFFFPVEENNNRHSDLKINNSLACKTLFKLAKN